jgi:solute carrier family 25 protein 39/40
MLALYRGWSPTILRDVPFSMIYWVNYELAKTTLLKRLDKRSLDSFATFFCGAISGSIAAIVTCPFDVVKTHRQIQLGETNLNKNAVITKNIIKEIFQTKGIQGLFAGIIFIK